MAEDCTLPGLDVLGVGYDARGRYADPEGIETRVIDLGALNPKTTKFGTYPKTVQFNEVQCGKVTTVYGQSLDDYAKTLKGRLNIDGKYGFFKGEIEASFSHQEKQSQSLQFMTVSCIQQGYKISLAGSARDWWEHLDSSFLRDVMVMEPKVLFETYGTHVLTRIFIGGKSQCSFSSRKSSSFGETEFRAAITAKYEALKAGIAVSADTTASWTNKNASISSNCGLQLIGGDTGCESIDTWRKTVSSNPVLIDFAHDGLVPLYEFCPDAARRKDLHTAFDEMFAISSQEIVLRTFSQDSTEVTGHPEAICKVDKGYKIISGGAKCWATSGPGQLLIAMFPGTDPLNPKTWVARSKDHLQVSAGKITAFCTALYDPKDEWEVKVWRASSPSAQHPFASVHVEDGYIMVGGGAYCETTGAGNLLQASFPSRNDTWSARATDKDVFSLGVLHVYVIGLRHKENPNLELTNHIYTETSTVEQDWPTQEIHPNAPDFTVIAGGAQIATMNAENFLTGSMRASDGNGWAVSGSDHLHPSPAKITAYALGLKGIRIRYAKTDKDVTG
ncbi:MAG: hypothetical protein JXQ84_07515 [Rhodospirillaceae bacterium]|nr:hypothetical protein [Rhodospirillaceae bacterium]